MNAQDIPPIRGWVVDALVYTALIDFYERRLLNLEQEHMDLSDKLAEVREKFEVLQENYASKKLEVGGGRLMLSSPRRSYHMGESFGLHPKGSPSSTITGMS